MLKNIQDLIQERLKRRQEALDKEEKDKEMQRISNINWRRQISMENFNLAA